MSNTIPFLEMWFWSTTLYQKEGVLLFLYAKEAKTQVNKGFLAAIAAKKLTLRAWRRKKRNENPDACAECIKQEHQNCRHVTKCIFLDIFPPESVDWKRFRWYSAAMGGNVSGSLSSNVSERNRNDVSNRRQETGDRIRFRKKQNDVSQASAVVSVFERKRV